MLNIVYRKEVSENDSIVDIDGAFLVKLNKGIEDTSTNRNLLRRIENGEYLSDDRYYDRFRTSMRAVDMSTGCKAAILVANQDIPVDLLECGSNARDAIIMECTSGTIIVHDFDDDLYLDVDDDSVSDWKIDVNFNGKHFNSFKKLGNYIEYEW